MFSNISKHKKDINYWNDIYNQHKSVGVSNFIHPERDNDPYNSQCVLVYAQYVGKTTIRVSTNSHIFTCTVNIVPCTQENIAKCLNNEYDLNSLSDIDKTYLAMQMMFTERIYRHTSFEDEGFCDLTRHCNVIKGFKGMYTVYGTYINYGHYDYDTVLLGKYKDKFFMPVDAGKPVYVIYPKLDYLDVYTVRGSTNSPFYSGDEIKFGGVASEKIDNYALEELQTSLETQSKSIIPFYINFLYSYRIPECCFSTLTGDLDY